MRKNKAIIIIWSLILIALVTAYFLNRISANERAANAVIVQGIITNKGKRAKGEEYVAYKFQVNGKEYFGTVSIVFCNDCKNNCCEIGAPVKVRYKKKDPTNNDLIH